MFRILFLVMAAVAFQQSPAPVPEADAKQQAEEEQIAKKFINGICSTCHTAELIVETRATKQEWLDIVKNMNGKGAGLSELDVELLSAYLARKYAPEPVEGAAKDRP